MSKFLLIGSVAAMLYGDCVWGMGDDIDPWRGTSSSESDQFNAEPARSNANPKVRSRRNSTAFSHDAQTQAEQFRAEHVQANPQQLQENRFIKIKSEYGQIYGGPSGAVLNNTYMQYHYALSNNSKIGRATPTTVVTVTRDDLKSWNDISEIRYANDVSYDKLGDPKVVLYRNFDKSCYIILRTDDVKKYGVFYGLNERNVEIGRNSFAVYDVSEDVGSFTDGVKRLIYVDESGLYFVPKAENSVENVINTYQNEGKFNFEGSVIKVSAIDGTITWNGEPVTADNFFDNWVLEEREVEREVSKQSGKTVVEKVKQNQNVLSTKQPKLEEIIRNFYPPAGYYDGILELYYNSKVFGGKGMDYLNAYGVPKRNAHREITINLKDRNWFNSFINNRLQIAKARSKSGAEELVRDGKFVSILDDTFITILYGNYDIVRLYGKIRDAIYAQFRDKKEKRQPLSFLIKDPDFVKSLKPAFAELEKDYEHNKESDMWILFEIVRNL